MEKLYRIIIDVQGFEELTICNELYDGIDNVGTIYSDFNGEAVIDYLKQWDGYEFRDDDLREEEPRWVNNGTDHVHTKDGYTLIYNSTIGGLYTKYADEHPLRYPDKWEWEDYKTEFLSHAEEFEKELKRKEFERKYQLCLDFKDY